MYKVFKYEPIDIFNKQYSESEIKHMITHLNYNLGSIITTQKLSLPLCIFIINIVYRTIGESRQCFRK